MKKNIILLILFCTLVMHTQGQTKTTVIAHRGAWTAPHIPENSIASLKKAIEIGCGGSEFDVWLTKDNIAVVHHDPTIDGLSIENSDWKELKKKKLSNGERMPTLKEYISTGMKQRGTRLVLEFKSSKLNKERTLQLAQHCVDLVKKMKAETYVDYIGFDYEGCKLIKKLDPKAKITYVNWKHDKEPAQLKTDGFYAVDYNYKVYLENPALIKSFRDLGIKLNVWTVNTADDMKWFVDKDFDYITTDHPHLLFETLKEN
ncbi:glycerophosphodiester phosphodiesterase [Sphingobacterium faecale]|uniref:Glycerophosphodiester phosphodiesterase n=1 Tax=Sphingobacterium faecale TaxID=2803775 RepID=A0ABS1R3P1_9SPHI|nr:glycerophosphodiester phosphodiesterase family protein [Sphingobacterium faecale]MBL1408895.1 glycerophosphodiester phosphodiesterase [Sphingobacterium faecale]